MERVFQSTVERYQVGRKDRDGRATPECERAQLLAAAGEHRDRVGADVGVVDLCKQSRHESTTVTRGGYYRIGLSLSLSLSLSSGRLYLEHFDLGREVDDLVHPRVRDLVPRAGVALHAHSQLPQVLALLYQHLREGEIPTDQCLATCLPPHTTAEGHECSERKKETGKRPQT